MVKKKACVFISGSGTNLRSIIKNSREYNFPINIKLVISNQKHADGINFAKKFSIPHIVLNYNRTKFEKIATKLLLEKKINLLTNKVNLDYIEMLYREKFLVGKPNEKIYVDIDETKTSRKN